MWRLCCNCFIVDCFQLWVANTRWPFHGEVIADVAAHQWWMGANPEALRKENMELFDINKVPLSSNMIALVCSAVSDHGSCCPICFSFIPLDCRGPR